jgi:predicted metal-dependent peptidase
MGDAARRDLAEDRRAADPPDVTTPLEGDALTTWLRGFVAEPTFLARYPYYAAILARMDPVADPTVEAMAVSLHGDRFYLHVNVDAFARAPEHLRGILLHEVHHIVLGHLTNPKFFDREHPDLMEIAEEMSANEHIEEPLPEPITWKHFERWGVRAGQSTVERYDLLAKARQATTQLAKPSSKTVDDHPWSQRAGGRGGGAGAVETTRRLLANAIADGEAAASQAAKLFPKAGLLAGKQPGRILELLTGVTARPETYVDWRDALRVFVGLRRAPVASWSRPSRRFPALVGQVPGRAWRAQPIDRPHLLVVLDTSMSMTDAELVEVARHLAIVGELARLTIVQCDTEVTSVEPFRGALTKVEGRGGTDLRPAFDDALVARERPDGIVCFTDGVGDMPARAPHVPVLWVLTKAEAFAVPWGERAAWKAGKNG